jgi:hypothetical protein
VADGLASAIEWWVSSKPTAGDLAAGECGANEIDAVEGDNGDNPAFLVPIVRTIEMGT